jgi:Fur family peroxide stress response transcriptional regulator
MQIEEYIDGFIRECRRHHLRVTPQRTAIYKTLAKAKNHPSADELFQAVRQEFPNISYDTVNRTLLTFSRIGLINLVEGHSTPRRFDPDLDNHHHFHCQQCGRIIDFTNSDYDDLEIPDSLRRRFDVTSSRVVLRGVCRKCSRNKFKFTKIKTK